MITNSEMIDMINFRSSHKKNTKLYLGDFNMAIQSKRIAKSDFFDEAILCEIFEKSDIGFELYNADGLLTDANPACLGIFGVSRVEEVKKFNLFEDPNLSYEFKKKLKMGETVRFQSIFDFEKVKQADLYKTSHSGTINLETQISAILSQILS